MDLDWNFLTTSKWGGLRKLEFYFKKYQLVFLLLFRLKKFKLGQNSVKLSGKRIYYDSIFGIAGYQSMVARNQKMIQDVGVNGIRISIDVGANVGFFSLMLKDIFPESRIYALEPIPQIFECLKKNLTANDFHIHRVALSDYIGEQAMVFNDLESSLSRLTNQEVATQGSHTEVLKVPVKTLDQFCSENNILEVDFLKIDTETFELQVLKGATKTLERTKYLHLEINILDNEKYTFSQINSLLFNQNYNFQLVYFRNFSDTSKGPIEVGDFLYKNVCLF